MKGFSPSAPFSKFPGFQAAKKQGGFKIEAKLDHNSSHQIRKYSSDKSGKPSMKTFYFPPFFLEKDKQLFAKGFKDNGFMALSPQLLRLWKDRPVGIDIKGLSKDIRMMPVEGDYGNLTRHPSVYVQTPYLIRPVFDGERFQGNLIMEVPPSGNALEKQLSHLLSAGRSSGQVATHFLHAIGLSAELLSFRAMLRIGQDEAIKPSDIGVIEASTFVIKQDFSNVARFLNPNADGKLMWEMPFHRDETAYTHHLFFETFLRGVSALNEIRVPLDRNIRATCFQGAVRVVDDSSVEHNAKVILDRPEGGERHLFGSGIRFSFLPEQQVAGWSWPLKTELELYRFCPVSKAVIRMGPLETLARVGFLSQINREMVSGCTDLSAHKWLPLSLNCTSRQEE